MGTYSEITQTLTIIDTRSGADGASAGGRALELGLVLQSVAKIIGEGKLPDCEVQITEGGSESGRIVSNRGAENELGVNLDGQTNLT